METATGRWIRQPPRPLRGEDSAGAELAALTGWDADHCDHVLRQFLTQGSQLRRTASSRFPIFAFRLHQFFTRGDTVWTTLEAESNRYLSLVKQGAQPGEPDKPLFPLVFCRQCGAAYYRVSDHVDQGGQRRLLPREDRREVGDDGQGDAYLAPCRRLNRGRAAMKPHCWNDYPSFQGNHPTGDRAHPPGGLRRSSCGRLCGLNRPHRG